VKPNETRDREGRKPTRIPTPPSSEEITRVLEAAKNGPVAQDLDDVVTLVLQTGMRTRELSNLRWTDVYLEKRYIAVYSNMRPQARRIPISTVALRILSVRLEREPASEFVLGSRPEHLLDRVARQLRALSGQLCSRPFGLHALRHAFAAQWVSSGGSAVTLASVMGHGSVFTTLKHFVPDHLLFEMAVQELAKTEAK
jgi:integrase